MVLDAVIERIGQPKVYNTQNDHSKEELKALVFDSQYDTYR